MRRTLAVAGLLVISIVVGVWSRTWFSDEPGQPSATEERPSAPQHLPSISEPESSCVQSVAKAPTVGDPRIIAKASVNSQSYTRFVSIDVSPDGSAVAIARKSDQERSTVDLFEVGAQTTIRLLSTPGTASVYFAEMGKAVYVVSSKRGSTRSTLQIFNGDGTKRGEPVNFARQVLDVASSDNLLLVSSWDSVDAQVSLVSAEELEEVGPGAPGKTVLIDRSVAPGTRFLGDASISSDGRLVVIASSRIDNMPSQLVQDVFLWDADTGGTEVLNRDDTGKIFEGLLTGRISEGGRYAFLQESAESRGVYVMVRDRLNLSTKSLLSKESSLKPPYVLFDSTADGGLVAVTEMIQMVDRGFHYQVGRPYLIDVGLSREVSVNYKPLVDEKPDLTSISDLKMDDAGTLVVGVASPLDDMRSPLSGESKVFLARITRPSTCATP